MPDSKPKISNLKQGVIECPNCSDIKALSDYDELNVNECSNCKTPFFVPMKVQHFWLYRPLGGGGMGSVYRALSEDEPGEFAIKILPRKKKADKELIDTLMMEGEVGKILGKSPHIVEVVDYGVDGDEHFMSSRFVAGTRLDIFVSSASRLSERQALDIITQIVDAEIQIKNCGYLFRDMKPENIIIVEETATAKLFDFGLCMSIEQAANPDPESHIEGSPYYLPPERIVASPEGEYSEVYSLGMLLFYMLAGTTYFSEADVRDLVSKHVRSLRVASVQSRLKHCSPQMVEIIDKMIKRDPNLRYHTLAEVAELLEDLSKGAEGYPLNPDMVLPPELMKPEQEVEKTRKPLNLKFLLISVGVTACLAIAALVGWYIMQKIEDDNVREVIIQRTASKLDINPDAKPPSLSESEIQALIKSEAKKIFDEELSYIKKFDDKYERAKICKDLSIDMNVDQTERIPLYEVKKLAKKKLNSIIEKELKLFAQEFPREKFKQQIPIELGLALPLKSKLVDHEIVKQEASQKANKFSELKFPGKLLARIISDIVTKYKCYNVGDRVTVPSRSGEKITGVYQGISGRRIIVDSRDVLLSDFPLELSVKFDKALSSKKTADAVKRANAEFKSKKAEYYKSVYEKEIENIYKENQYFKVKNKWVPASYVINKKLKEKEKEFESKQRDGEEKIITAAKKSFDAKEFYKKYGYRYINNKWVSNTKMVEDLLNRKEKKFNSQRMKKINDLEKEARISAELKVYEENGYIYRNGKWQPAKQLLDSEVNKALKKRDSGA